MNFSDGELSIYFIWLLVWQRGCNSTWYKSTVVLKWLFKRTEKNQKMNEAGGGKCCFVFFLYQQSTSGLLILSPLNNTNLVIGFGRVPFLLCLTVKVELGKRGKKCSQMCAAPFHLHRWWVRSLRKGLCILSRHNFTATWSDDGLILLKWWCTSWETVGV